MSERVAPFLPPRMSDDDTGNDAISREQLVVPAQKKPGRFDPKPMDERARKHLEAYDQKIATEEADRLFRRYLRVRAQWQQDTQDTPTPHLLDFYYVSQDLWKHLEHEPVELGRKALIKSAIEPDRRRLRTDPYAGEIAEALKEQQRIDRAYREAKLLWVRAHAARTNEILHPLLSREARVMVAELETYLSTSLIKRPTAGMISLDQEIRAIAAEIFRGQSPSTDLILFNETQHYLSAWRAAYEEERRNPNKGTKDRLEKTQRAFEKALEQEMLERRTPEMKVEHRGLMGLKRQLFRDPFIAQVYEDLEMQDRERVNEIALSTALAQLRPGELAAITRLRRYEKETVMTHKHLIITQHDLFSKFTEEPDEAKNDGLRGQSEQISRRLKEPILCYAPHSFTVEGVVRVIHTLHARWAQKAPNPESPSHAEELGPLWQSLQAQYGYVFQLAEALNQVMDRTPLEEELETSIQETLANMRRVEQHYATCVFRPLQENARAVDGDLWLLENTTPPNKDALVEKTKRALDEVEVRTRAITMSFPSIIRWPDIKEFTHLTIPALQRRFEERTGIASTATTARPPRPGAPDTNPVSPTDREQE